MEFIDKKRLPSWREKIVLKNKNAEKLNNFVESLSRGKKKSCKEKVRWDNVRGNGGSMELQNCPDPAGINHQSLLFLLPWWRLVKFMWFVSDSLSSEVKGFRRHLHIWCTDWWVCNIFNMSLIFMNANSKKIQWEMHLISGCEDLGMLRFLS
jgi:hypothetical protein